MNYPAFYWFTLSLLLFSGLTLAGIETYQFETAEQEALYKKLTKELRCTVCQNQDIADSNAELATDLRRKTREMVSRGENEQFVLDYMSQRYGDFVLYRPRLQANTLVLWIGPFLILLLAMVVVFRFVKGRTQAIPATLSEQQRKRLRELLGEDEKP